MKHFLRIDDIGRWQYQINSINKLMSICAEKQIKLVLSVITAELDQETIDYIKLYAKETPGLVELFFHGHTHDLLEFSSVRNKFQQRASLIEGVRFFEEAFGVIPKGFVPPEHICTADTIAALDDLGFECLSKQFKPTLDGFIFYTFGKLLRAWFLVGKKISYHPELVARSSMKELSISIELAEKNIIKSTEVILAEYNQAKKYTDYIGFLIHPQVLEDKGNVSKFYQFLSLSEEHGWDYGHLCGAYLPS